MPPKYRYFNPQTDPLMVGLKDDLLAPLDRARHKCGFPFKILSGLRSEEQNKKAGGHSKSAHLFGWAVDLEATDDIRRFKMVKALMEEGIRRIEVSKDGHVHADIAGEGYAQDWLGIE